jgi:purine-nucleoside phosphorylase
MTQSAAKQKTHPAPASPSPAKLAAAIESIPDLSRHIIMFDRDDPSTYSPHTLPPALIMGAEARAPIPWPDGTAPVPQPLAAAPSADAPLPKCDYVIVTWTVEEAKCLADTLTPGFPSKTAWYQYAHNFQSEFASLIRNGAPASMSKRLGSYFLTSIAGKKALCMKSELHMSQDGPKLPIALLWKQIIAETECKLIITTGTAGGIGASVELGDVVVASEVRFDCQKSFKNSAFHDSLYKTSHLKHTSYPVAEKLFAANAPHLPVVSRPQQIFTKPVVEAELPDVVTTDFFAFDDSSNTFGLQSLGAAVEMGDAVLGMVISELGTKAPKWAAIRNASDPQIDDSGLSLKEAADKAGQIYEKFGYWTTIPSAITCWATVKDN